MRIDWLLPTLDRRRLLRLGGLTAGAGATSIAGINLGARVGSGARPKQIEAGAGTNIAAAVSPDGRTIAIDLLGLLWLVPALGGRARCITDAFADAAYPCWSPDGRQLAFQSYRSGNFHIWTMAADGSGARQLTSGFADHREPFFTPDGRSILFSSDMSGRYAIHRLDLGKGSIDQVSHGSGQDSEPCISRDGRRIAFVVDGVRVMVMDEGGSPSEAASVPASANWTRPSQVYAPAFRPDGALCYISIGEGVATLHSGDAVLVRGEDIHPFRPSWLNDALIYTADGQIRRRPSSGAAVSIPFEANIAASPAQYTRRQRDFSSRAPRDVLGIASPVLAADGQRIAFAALNDIYLLKIGNSQPKKLTSGPSHKSHPTFSPDGRTLVFSDDRSGVPNLWRLDLESGALEQLTALTSSAALYPCFSPDGARIAFLNHAGAVHLLELSSGAVRQIYDPLWLPGRPSFGPDGSKLVLAAFKPISRRFREGLSEVLTIDLGSGKGRYTPVGSERSIATRGDDGPVWSPDGRNLAYVFASTLWIQPVGRDGAFEGAARQLTRNVTDAPSWSGDSGRLLYLHNGQLRMLHVESGKEKPVPLRFSWALADSPRTSIIRGARIWDGLQPDYQQGDVILRGNRIAGIAAPASADSDDALVIDGAGLTLLPGLIDMHTHRQVAGNGYGGRMGHMLLTFGITSSRSPGGAAYHMAQDREAVDAGMRVAPRHFGTGEALDGSRIYYNFMRPVTEPGQLELELSRAAALQYDMIKTYVRMDNRTQAKVIAAAHALGIPVSSHYHYPALRFGADGVEHLGATSRFGFSRTLSSLGAASEDVHRLFAATGAARVPTLFAANALLADDPGLVEDRRARMLLPPWEYERFSGLARLIRDGDRGPLLASLARNVAQIRALLALGGRVVTGTDAPIDTVGISYHLNLRAMTRFGISPHQALLTGTRYAAEQLEEPLGVIAKDKLADLILVEGDPLVRIEDAANVRLIVRDGRAISVEDLLKPFDRLPEPGPAAGFASAAREQEYWWHDPAYGEAHDCLGTAPAFA